MPKYFYTARSQITGEPKSGTIEAKNIHEIAKTLHQEGYVLISATLEEDFNKKIFDISIPFLDRVSLKEKIFFTRNLRVMIGSGLPLPRALKTLASQTKSRKFKKALLAIKEEVAKGNNFSQALSLYPEIFSELFQNMVKVGEESGTLEDVLKMLTEQMEREYDLKSKIMGAMAYPAVVILAMIGIGILMLIMVVPKLAETFQELNVELPFTTRLVIFIGNFLAHEWYFAILLIAGALVFFRLFFSLKIGKKISHFIFLNFPIISGIVKQTNSAYFTRTLSSLIAAGVPLVRSLEIISKALGNIYFQEAIGEAADRIKQGEKLHEALIPYRNIFPEVLLEMVEVGEETGETSLVLAKLADFFEEEATTMTKNISSIIEPILMLVIGATVGFFAISMVQPMYSMLQSFQ